MEANEDLKYNEALVLQQLARGSEQAFTQLFDRYQVRIFATANSILKSREHAQEIVQEVFLRVWTNREKFSKVENAEAYIFIMARNLTLKFLRKLLNERSCQFQFAIEHEGVDNTIEHLLLDKEYDKIVNQTLAMLPSQQRQVYHLARVDGLTHADIAQKMNISPWTVSNHMKSALKFIRQKLGPFARFNLSLILLRIFDQ
jgi:RNA polymerase sigma-70 factor (family 1)